MPGLFQRLFSSRGRRARWQHEDPTVRARAAAQLDANDHSALEALAGDDDARVREAALARIDDLDRVFALHRQSPCEESRQRLTQLLTGRSEHSRDLQSRLDWLERRSAESPLDIALIEAVIVDGDNQSLRLAALSLIEDEAHLVRHASENGISAVRHAAAERVTSEAGLSRLVKQARRDKQVARLARDRLANLRADAEQQAAAHLERERLLTALETQANRPWEPMFEARLKHWVAQWEALDGSAETEQRERFDAAVTRCRQRIAEHLRHQRESERLKQEKAEAQSTRESILEALSHALTVVESAERLTPDVMESLEGKWQLQNERWQEVSDRYGVSDHYQQRYVELNQRAQTIWQAWERWQSEAPALEAAIEQDAAVAPALSRLDWPAALPPTDLLLEARRQTASAAVAKPTPTDLDVSHAQLEEWLEALAGELDAGRYRGATQLHRRLRQAIGGQESSLPEALQQHWKQQHARLAELRDWRGFAAAPKRESLVADIEALAEARDHSDPKRHRRHQQLVREWRQLGDAAATKPLAQRFRSASDSLHDQLGAWEQEIEAQEAQNLEARQALCEQLESLLDHPSDVADPDGLRRIRDAAQEQWDRHWPVPRRQAASTGRRFSRLRQRLQSLIDERAGDIASRKRDLVQQAQQLAEDDGAAAERAEQAKALQKQWQALGRAPKGVEQALWRQFRSHCDTIFAARESVRGEQRSRQQQRFEEMQALIDRLDAWQPARAAERDTLDAALAEAQRLAPLPRGRRSDGMEKRWQGIVHAREVTLDRLALVEQARQWPAYRRWLEAAIDGEPLDSSSFDDAPADIRATVSARSSDSDSEAAAEDALQRCLVQLGLLAGEPIPESLEPLRLEVQVARLNDGLGRPPTPPEELEQTLHRLLSVAPLSRETWERYASAFDHVLGEIGQARHADDHQQPVDSV
ncbi:DUF349 domain-containing protein [Salinicola rhizosphaerae]|uniref:DUF349 domain-containing protein n=1 Tax=Salinicola rhizosphaerae TaxID=1443141 RepID=A0ABQ3DVL9_9GAMM|nr:DUF349 domain-containing protein [Salinicola rhizosphaerae]GHB17074.1 hypothetical protein GCM10009038_14720 [Salinicola rhizosphaerae]